MTESKVAAAQFSFKLATPAELFLGGLNSALYMVASTVWYPVTTKAYWMITGAATVNGAVAVDSIDCIIDTGTSVVVAPTAAAAAYWNAVPNSASYGGGYYTFELVFSNSLVLAGRI